MKKILLTGLTLALVIGGTTAVFAAVSDDPAPSQHNSHDQHGTRGRLRSV